ncbi:hypothetical protein N9060_02100, partial [Arenicella sp.]|nr:hypothetical protein [Arenicella sp.]
FESASWITRPPEFAVQRALRRLESLSAVDGNGLTERGRRLARLPVSADEAALLVDAPPSIDATLCDLVAILQSRGSLLRNLNDLRPEARALAEDARAELLEGVSDEVTTNLKLLQGGVATTHQLSRRPLDEARSISRQLRELIGAKGESSKGLAKYILTRLPAAGFVKRPRASKERGRSVPWANGSIEVKVYPFEPVDPGTDAWKSNAAVILETEWLSVSNGVFGVGRMVLPTELEILAIAGLGESKLASTSLERKSRGRIKILAVRQVQLAGVTLSSGELELSGNDLHQAVAGFVLQNRLFKGAGDAVREALHAWRLLANWRGEPLSDYQTPVEAIPDDEAAWLAQRLATLGVESAADLPLVDTGDLLPNLESETGIPKWVADPILNAFPRVWSYEGGTYSCTVLHESRTVQLEPLDQKARKGKEPPAWALPGLHGFRVTYKQGSRKLKLR